MLGRCITTTNYLHTQVELNINSTSSYWALVKSAENMYTLSILCPLTLWSHTPATPFYCGALPLHNAEIEAGKALGLRTRDCPALVLTKARHVTTRWWSTLRIATCTTWVHDGDPTAKAENNKSACYSDTYVRT